MKKINAPLEAVRFNFTEPKKAEDLNNSAKQMVDAIYRNDPRGFLENLPRLLRASVELVSAVESQRK